LISCLNYVLYSGRRPLSKGIRSLLICGEIRFDGKFRLSDIHRSPKDGARGEERKPCSVHNELKTHNHACVLRVRFGGFAWTVPVGRRVAVEFLEQTGGERVVRHGNVTPQAFKYHKESISIASLGGFEF
jgi:hypothetical protein